MKKYLYLIFIFLFIGVFISCDEEDEIVEAVDGTLTAASFYPGKAGSSFDYEGDVTSDSTSVPTERTAVFSSGKTVNGVTYLKQTNKVGGISAGEIYFRTDDAGVYYYINTDDFVELLDSLGLEENKVELSADSEIQLISYPFTSDWDSFSLTIDSYDGIPLSVDILKLSAEFEGKETITVGDESITTRKIIYTCTIGVSSAYSQYLPEIPSMEFETTLWFGENVGLVKTEGSSFVSGVISGSNVELSDSSATMTETLVDYNIVN